MYDATDYISIIDIDKANYFFGWEVRSKIFVIKRFFPLSFVN